MPGQEFPMDGAWPKQKPYEFQEWPKVVRASDGKDYTFASQAEAEAFEESLHPQKGKSKAGKEAEGKEAGASKAKSW